MKYITGTHRITELHPELLRDESSLSGGSCQCAAWPEGSHEAADFFVECMEDDIPVTISGARTGVTGGSVPMGGAVLSTELMKGIFPTRNETTITVRAGETIDSVASYCRRHLPSFFYPPDPTETSASVGGTVATNASGAGSYMYGSTRKWIKRLQIVLRSGTIINLVRGEYVFRNGKLTHPVFGTLELPRLKRPQPEKNTAGLYISPHMDLIDLFIGSEGQLGLISEADLSLHKKPYSVTSFAVFCNEEQFWNLRESLMASDLSVRELEAMIPPSLSFLAQNTGRTFPDTAGDWVLIVSIEADNEEEIDTILDTLELLLNENGVPPENTWGGFDETERTRLKGLRHDLPETINRIVSAHSSKNRKIHKISTDTAVPAEHLREYYGEMRRILGDSGAKHVVFGHCGQGHLHANLLPIDDVELRNAEHAAEAIAKKAIKFGGTVSAEHGIGKLKANFLRFMYSETELNAMLSLTRKINNC